MARQLRMSASLPLEETIRWRLRVAVLIISAIILLALVAARWIASSYEQPSELPQRTSIFDRELKIVAGESEPTAEQLLQVAEQEAQWLGERFPDSAAAHCVAADRAYSLGNLSAARDAWQRALEAEPLYPEAIYGLALLAFEQGDYEETVELGELLGTLESDDPRTPLLLADAYRNLNRIQEAILLLEQHISSELSTVQAWESLGDAHLMESNFPEAIHCFERVLEFAPDSKDALYGLGQAYARIGKPEKAKKYLAKFQEVADSSSAAQRSQARGVGDFEHAASVLAQVYIGTSRVLKDEGDLEAAETKALKAVKLQPDKFEQLRELQRIVQANGKQWEAIEVGEKIVALESQDVDQWLNLGTLYAEVEQVDQAIEAFQQAISIDPKDPRCQRAQVIIRRLRFQ